MRVPPLCCLNAFCSGLTLGYVHGSLCFARVHFASRDTNIKETISVAALKGRGRVHHSVCTELEGQKGQGRASMQRSTCPILPLCPTSSHPTLASHDNRRFIAHTHPASLSRFQSAPSPSSSSLFGHPWPPFSLYFFFVLFAAHPFVILICAIRIADYPISNSLSIL